eukprot:jgi/Chlat1/3742/Chrsp259S03886
MRRARRRRFTPLLLDEGEDHETDVAASCLAGEEQQENSSSQPVRGRLWLNTASLVWEPDDFSYPVTRIPFAHTKELKAVRAAGLNALAPSSAFTISATRAARMRHDGADVPYVIKKGSQEWRFSLEYASLDQFIGRARELWRVGQLPYAQREAELNALKKQREDAAAFDTSHLRTLSERILADLPAAHVTPLIKEPGRLVVTQANVYFQPLHALAQPVLHQPMQSIAAVARRRHALRPLGLELFFSDKPWPSDFPAGGASAFFAFRSEAVRETAMAALVSAVPVNAAAAGSLLEPDSGWLKKVAAAWCDGRLTNRDYLLFLNLAAGRSFCDLALWPVMPWVLLDYTSSSADLTNPKSFRDLSKPIGALNPTRLALLKERYEQMKQAIRKDPTSQPPFMYGTHYSAPGYVLFWLVRSAPAHALRLGGGKFDVAERAFGDAAHVWRSVLENPADVKELIPEFYSGSKQGGETLNDVTLPAWAPSPKAFINMQRKALESGHVSANLHHWIDLIFGYKQRGEAAEAANNVFVHLTYDGAVDIDSVRDPVERAGLEAQAVVVCIQINEFGQTPRQLFFTAHAPRLRQSEATAEDCSQEEDTTLGLIARVVAATGADLSTPPAASSLDNGPSSNSTASASAESSKPVGAAGIKRPLSDQLWQQLLRGNHRAVRLHRETVSGVQVVGDELYTCGHDAFLKVYSLTSNTQVRAGRVGELPLSSLAVSTSDESKAELVWLASYDNSIYAYSSVYGRVVGSLQAHDAAVSRVVLTDSQLFSASWDATVKAWDTSTTGMGARLPTHEMAEHESMVVSLDATTNGSWVLSGSEEGVVIAWDPRSAHSSWIANVGDGACVSDLSITQDERYAVTAGGDGMLRLLDLRTSGAELSSMDCEDPLKSCATDGRCGFAGSDAGRIHWWPMWRSHSSSASDIEWSEEEVPKYKDTGSASPVTSIMVAAAESGDCMLVGGADGQVRIYMAS